MFRSTAMASSSSLSGIGVSGKAAFVSLFHSLMFFKVHLVQYSVFLRCVTGESCSIAWSESCWKVLTFGFWWAELALEVAYIVMYSHSNPSMPRLVSLGLLWFVISVDLLSVLALLCTAILP